MYREFVVYEIILIYYGRFLKQPKKNIFPEPSYTKIFQQTDIENFTLVTFRNGRIRENEGKLSATREKEIRPQKEKFN